MSDGKAQTKKNVVKETDHEKIKRLERQNLRNKYKFDGQRDKLLSENQKNINHLARGRELLHRVTSELTESKRHAKHAAMRIESLMTLIAVMVGEDQTLLIDPAKVKDATGKWFVETTEDEPTGMLKLTVRIQEEEHETEPTLVPAQDEEVHAGEDCPEVPLQP